MAKKMIYLLIIILIQNIYCSTIRNYKEPVEGYPLSTRNWKRGIIGNGRLLCLIHTAKPSHLTLAKTVYETWGNKCDDLLFFTNSKMEWNIPHIYFPEFGTRDHSWEKVRNVMRFVFYKTKGQYDWYLRADDDAYVFVKHAKQFLENHDPNRNHLLGYRWGFFLPDGYADGGTYILSWKALESFVNVTYDQKLCPEYHRAEEDQELSRCFKRINITLTDTRDSQGRDRFHQFHPEERQFTPLAKFIRRSSYYRYFQYPDNVSPSTVAMHHWSPYEMRFIDFLFSKVEISDK